MTSWKDIETAPKDGSTIKVRRLFDGEVIYEGPAVWRQHTFDALYDPISGEKFADAGSKFGWMYVDKNYLVPTPTHWRRIR